MKEMLIIVDAQKDFVNPDGALPVSTTFPDAVIKNINELTWCYKNKTFSQDWHPENHISFKQWPKHCVAKTEGARIVEQIIRQGNLIQKGKNIDKEEYSAFDGDFYQSAVDVDERYRTNAVEKFKNYLFNNNFRYLTVCGFVTEYCVEATVLDGLKYGFGVIVPFDACASLSEEGERRAIHEMAKKGAIICSTNEIIKAKERC